MFTIKQLQTFYWVARLGTLKKAADKLHITQSAVTKRLQEVEAIASTALFENDSRRSMLTPHGKALIVECERLFELIDELEELKGHTRQPARTLHVGLTELIALTWFPDFLRRMKTVYPTVTVQPEIDLSSLLRKKVEDGRLDFAFIPDPSEKESLVRAPIGQVQFGWFAAPGIFDPNETYSLPQLAAQPVVEQSEHSIITALCSRLWEGAGVHPKRIYGGNNVVALAGLISAGIGISCLPVALFAQDLAAGKLQLIATNPPAPSVKYFCCFLKYPQSSLGYNVAEIAQQSSTFIS